MKPVTNVGSCAIAELLCCDVIRTLQIGHSLSRCITELKHWTHKLAWPHGPTRIVRGPTIQRQHNEPAIDAELAHSQNVSHRRTTCTSTNNATTTRSRAWLSSWPRASAQSPTTDCMRGARQRPRRAHSPAAEGRPRPSALDRTSAHGHDL